jgi:3-oxoacyl-[acyl-carrier-protein] synthase II
MRRRVVITGIGMVTPLGLTAADTFAALLEGKSGAGPITHIPAATYPTNFACEVKGFDLSRYVADVSRYRATGPNIRFAVAAARQALDDANLNPHRLDPTRVGVYLGAGEGGDDVTALVTSAAGAADESGFKVDHGKFCEIARRLHDPKREENVEMHQPSAFVADEFDLCGPNLTTLTACAASAQAVGEAAELIRYGDADVMVSGGSHSMIHTLGVTGFTLLTALSRRNDAPAKASRPFDLTRDGFVLGEGGGMVILEEYEHAKKRGATIYAELTGYGTTGDAYRMTDPHPEGRGAVKAMKDAMRNAGITGGDIGYINAHGTSTPANDESETAAIKGSLGEAAYRVPVSSTKSMMGHLIAAGGVVELIVSVLAMRQGVLPPTINYETPDPLCDLDYVPNTAREVAGVRHVLSNSFGFGGQNITLVASRL